MLSQMRVQSVNIVQRIFEKFSQQFFFSLAILIVEFAKQAQEERGLSPIDAAVEASQLRLRPILMTAFAFILGVLPLMVASGPGSEMRQALGTAVFFGMSGVTVLGLFFTPIFYVALRSIFPGKQKTELTV